MNFRRVHKNEVLTVTFAEYLQTVYNDGERVIVKNEQGNVMLNCSHAVYQACWDRGWFVKH